MWFPAHSHPHAVHATRLFDWGCERQGEPSVIHVTQYSQHTDDSLLYVSALALLSGWNVFHILLHLESLIHPSESSSYVTSIMFSLILFPSSPYWRAPSILKCVLLTFDYICRLQSNGIPYKQGIDYLFIHFCQFNQQTYCFSKANKGQVCVFRKWRP